MRANGTYDINTATAANTSLTDFALPKSSCADERKLSAIKPSFSNDPLAALVEAEASVF